MTTSTVAPEIAAFAAAVRDALADLPEEERDELTDGLEADLSESLAEDLRRTLPDPVAYAAELRAAAGLPARVKSRGTFAGLAQGWRDTLADVGIAIRRNPALGGALDFANALRPIWWILRAWLAAWLLASFFGVERGYGFAGGWWLVLAAFVVVSVQWGRGNWHTRAVPALIVIGNVIAVIVLLPVLAAADDGGNGDSGFDRGYSAGAGSVLNDPAIKGLSNNGHLLENIYAYDASGKPLHNVQLFDVDGNPLVTSRDVDQMPLQPAPAKLETGTKAYNVFPLSLTKMMWDQNGELVPDPSEDPGKKAAFRNGPFLKVPAVLDAQKVANSNH
ncbi:MAG: hypothetical protein JWQ70_3241 [Aeromicrobium sp.]|nr:hypothetical protein [Aeromicrobium sp.]